VSAPAGNLADKYGSANPVARRLTAGFLAALDELLGEAAPGSLLDVGCGEGVVTERFAEQLGDGRVVGADVGGDELRGAWEQHARANVEYRTASADALPFADGEFEAAAAIELLEHVPDPRAALREMARVARGHLLLSVPREPLWRALNLARGAYWGSLGNTPGHLNHFSRRAFVRAVAEHGRVVAVRSPLPWTVVLVRLEHEGRDG
jgi:2-polyprenyl-3-methyl-5-hydroxy-6-metoxy-1,4-benzoquinol methylase